MARRHKYHGVEPNMHEEPFGKGLRVPDDFWRFPKGKEDPADLSLRTIIVLGEAALAHLHTGALRSAACRLGAVRVAQALGGSAEWWQSLQKTWVGCYLNAPILIRRVVPRLPAPWCFAIGDIFGTA